MIDGMHALIQNIPLIQEGKKYREMAGYYRELYGENILKERRILYVTNDTCHPNVIGHKIIADILFERVFKERIKD